MTTLHNTIEQGKRLKELGVESVCDTFYYEGTLYYRETVTDWGHQQYFYDTHLPFYKHWDILPALTLGELVDVIDWSKSEINSPNVKRNVWFFWRKKYDAATGTIPTHLAADVLIYLLEQGIVTAEAVNEKLKNLK